MGNPWVFHETPKKLNFLQGGVSSNQDTRASVPSAFASGGRWRSAAHTAYPEPPGRAGSGHVGASRCEPKTCRSVFSPRMGCTPNRKNNSCSGISLLGVPFFSQFGKMRCVQFQTRPFALDLASSRSMIARRDAAELKRSLVVRETERDRGRGRQRRRERHKCQKERPTQTARTKRTIMTYRKSKQHTYQAKYCKQMN